MIEIDGILVSPELFEEHFRCDLAKCKGACCVEGDSGAPVSETEKQDLARNLEAVKTQLPPSGKEALEAQGPWVHDTYDGEAVTPLVMGRHCAYVQFNKDITYCGIEAAWKKGLSDFRKPVSCHLYPIRIQQTEQGEYLRYDRWPICAPACACGLEQKTPVYLFCKEALIRKYGTEWYGKLEEAAHLWLSQKMNLY